MSDLEKKVISASINTYNWVKGQAIHTGIGYYNLIRHPSNFPKSVGKLLKDTFYELPASFYKKTEDKTLKEILDIKHSQAVMAAEMGGFLGRLAGVGIFSYLGAGEYSTAVIGGLVGDYIGSMAGLFGTYVISTRKHLPLNEAVKRGGRMMRNATPSEIILYLIDALWLSSFTWGGLDKYNSQIINFLIHMSVCAGVMKHVTRNEATRSH